ncbi:hypothetical protein LK09_06125 [Microbacterium mangrovi]|uniref:Uncharacterized protein n=1 Tax=Microbacterium mangrovi TaxID=1348253 RepID=A0A0B2A4V9_9MICO|nr:hypothetical protein [Microbacterium mangrovi]KHK98549.1 hypothetical protein LK09_06125 [Microbacterium mangrovi]
MSPTLTAALLGAAAAGLFALFGAWVQGRREHVKWLREKRYDAYTKAEALFINISMQLVHLDELKKRVSAVTETNDPAEIAEETDRGKAKVRSMMDSMATDLTAITILGPEPVTLAAKSLAQASAFGDQAAIQEADRALLTAMRVALGSARRPWYKFWAPKGY